MADFKVFPCNYCRALNMYDKKTTDDILLLCYNCSRLQLIPGDAVGISTDKHDDILSHGYDGIGEGQDLQN